MARIKLYLDIRKAITDGRYPMKIRVSLLGHGNFMLPTGIYVSQNNWINNKIVGNPALQSMQNNALKYRIHKIEATLLQLELTDKLDTMTLKEIKAVLGTISKTKTIEADNNLINEHFKHFLKFKNKKSTIETYNQTLIKIGSFADINTLTFADINLPWLRRFEKFLADSGLSINTISIHLRNLRSIYNNAIDEDVISQSIYPFRKFNIKTETTIKRSLTVEQLRLVRDFDVEEYQERYRDTFMLIFYLMGINIIDLCEIKEIDNTGRIVFTRAKTGKLYSIKVEPEAMVIIGKYKGKEHLLNFSDVYGNYQDYMRKVNRGLQAIGEVTILKHGKKERNPIFPDLTTYWARHTWATIAADLDIPDETISLALGHSGSNKTTNIYINRNHRKVDEANRKVIDYLNEV